MKYKAVGFDYGGVIGGLDNDGAEFNRQLCQILDTDLETYKKLYYTMNHKINLGEVETWKDFWKLFLDKFGKPEKLDEVIAWSNRQRDSLLVFNLKAIDLVDEVRSKGFKVGLLSNNTKEMGTWLKQKGLTEHFDVVRISAEAGYMKPDPRAFADFAKALVVNMEELVFIDDAQKSLETAEECGFTPIRYENVEQTRQELTKLGAI